MSTDALSAIGAVAAIQANAATAGTTGPAVLVPMPGLATPGGISGVDASAQFGQLVSDGLQGVNQALLASQTDLQELAVGNAQNLHQIMMRLEESRLSFQLLVQVRGRLLEAYQDVMKMQV